MSLLKTSPATSSARRYVTKLQSDGTIGLSRLAPGRRRSSLARSRLTLGPAAGRLALGLQLAVAFVVVMFTSARASAIVPQSSLTYPNWMAGPLHGLFGGLTNNTSTLNLMFTLALLVTLVAYGVVLAAVRTLSMRTIWASAVALAVIMLLGPPLLLTDIFNYLGYARLGALHHMNPYTHVIGAIRHDPVYLLSTWRNYHSPYGELFTAITYPIGLLPLGVGYWVLKVITVVVALAFLWVVSVCARQLGRDPRLAVALIAFNPLFVIYGIGGFHNDFFMLLPMTAAIALLLARRDRSAGAALMLAVGIKYTAVLLLPFMLIAVPTKHRRLRIVQGASLTAIPLVIGSLLLFGTSLANVSQQARILTNFSIPQVVGLLLGIGGGTPTLLKVFDGLFVATVVYLIWRRRDWLSSAGWATLALIASLSWLMPWYILWALPFAALATSARLRRATLALNVFLVLTFLPNVWVYMEHHHINPLRSPAGRASAALQKRLESNP
jgi:alpha-1,6-mannosyltransferase